MKAKFLPGACVKVKAALPSGHSRTPYYTRGHIGVIETVLGPDPVPERLAYGRLDQAVAELYRVRFRQTDLWPCYTGSSNDTVVVDLFEHSLEVADHVGS